MSAEVEPLELVREADERVENSSRGKQRKRGTTHPKWNRSKTPSAYTLTGLPTGGGFVLYPAGSDKVPIGGGGIARFSVPFSFSLVISEGFLPLRPTLSAISTLASVVSLGSPGSAADWLLASAMALARSELARCLLGGWADRDDEVALSSCFRFWSLPDSGAVVSPSSPEASRDDGCRAGSIMSKLGSVVEGRFRLPEWVDEDAGEDITMFLLGGKKKKGKRKRKENGGEKKEKKKERNKGQGDGIGE